MSEMPGFWNVMLLVLCHLAKGKTRVCEIVPALQGEFGLSDEEMGRLLPSGCQTYTYDGTG